MSTIFKDLTDLQKECLDYLSKTNIKHILKEVYDKREKMSDVRTTVKPASTRENR